MTATAGAIEARPPHPATALVPLLRGVTWGFIGFAIGAGLTAAVRQAIGESAWALEMSVTIGYVFGLTGWILGVGVWDRWGREWFGLPMKSREPTGSRRF